MEKLGAGWNAVIDLATFIDHKGNILQSGVEKVKKNQDESTLEDTEFNSIVKKVNDTMAGEARNSPFLYIISYVSKEVRQRIIEYDVSSSLNQQRVRTILHSLLFVVKEILNLQQKSMRLHPEPMTYFSLYQKHHKSLLEISETNNKETFGSVSTQFICSVSLGLCRLMQKPWELDKNDSFLIGFNYNAAVSIL